MREHLVAEAAAAAAHAIMPTSCSCFVLRCLSIAVSALFNASLPSMTSPRSNSNLTPGHRAAADGQVQTWSRAFLGHICPSCEHAQTRAKVRRWVAAARTESECRHGTASDCLAACVWSGELSGSALLLPGRPRKSACVHLDFIPEEQGRVSELILAAQ